MVDKREAPVRIVLSCKNQKSANVVRKQLADLSWKINADISPVCTSRKIKDAWCIHSSVVCVMQAMSATRADTYTNELKNTEQSETNSESSAIWSQKTSQVILLRGFIQYSNLKKVPGQI